MAAWAHFTAEEGVKSKVVNDRKLRLSESLKVGDPICGKVLGIHNVADPVAL